jgi:uncharacterized protein (UPF0335 family)
MSEEHAGIVDRDALKRYTDRIVSLRADRKEINETMGGVFKEAKDAGFVPEMIRGVVRELEMEDDARDTFFATQAAYRRALGLLADLPLGRAAMARPKPLAEQPLHRGRKKKDAKPQPDKAIWDGSPSMPAGTA